MALEAKKERGGKAMGGGGTTSSSLPDLHTAERVRERDSFPLVAEHGEGPYFHNGGKNDPMYNSGKTQTPQTIGKYQNVGNTGHMVGHLLRVSSGSAHNINWQVNLRGGAHASLEIPSQNWRRHHTKSHQSFDFMKENCSADNEEYMNSQTTPQDRRTDRRYGAVAIETIRDDPIDFTRFPGCEGSNGGQWMHLVTKNRRQLAHETTLRQAKGDTSGSCINDQRSDACMIEMLGKKKWIGAERPGDPLSSRPPTGDPKLYYLSQVRLLPEADEDNRQLRTSKTQRNHTRKKMADTY